MKRFLCFAILIVILLVSVSCGKSGNFTPAGIDVVEVPSPSGADSVKVLVEKTVEFLRNDLDYSKIKDVHDPLEFLAIAFIKELDEYEELTDEQAREKAKLIYGTAEELKEKDPELEEAIRDDFDVIEPEEAVNEFMTDVRNAIRNGEIKSGDPDYEKYSKMLTDWDKGADYMLKNYPEIKQNYKDRDYPIGMDGALELLRSYAQFKSFNRKLARFKNLKAEFKPENINVWENGYSSYEIGSVVEEDSAYSLEMIYYYRDGRYFILSYVVSIGGIGG